MSASINLLLKEVNDATECPICTGIFSSPKMLPCFHTFCLKCIEQYGKDTPEGDTLTCPLCRGEFKVPVGGLSKLRSNFFLEGLIATVESVPGMSQAVYCDVCLSGKKCKETASSFCAECQQSMCDQCSNIHGSIRTTMTHHLSPLGDESSKEVLRKKLKKHFCETHPFKVIEFYCEGCKVSICGTCSITKHNKHDIREIAEIAEESKTRFTIYSNKASNLMMNIKERLAKVFEQLDSFADSIEQMKMSIERRGEDIKRMVDKQTNDLLGELNDQKAILYKTVELTKEDLQRDLLICDSFKQFCTKIVTEADHVETVSVADEVETRAAELNMMSIPELEICLRLKFIPSNFDITGNQQNIVGTLFEQNEKSVNPITELQTLRFRMKLPTSGCVQGITSWNDELYVVTYLSTNIDVYDINTMAHRRKISVEGLVNGWDIAAHANVLYVSDRDAKLIHRIQLPDETSSHWSVNSEYLRMSINKKGNIVFSCRNNNKITEYTPIGNRVRKIKVKALDGTNRSLQHAIELDDDRFLICHATPTHSRVCIIDSNGRMMKSYGGEAGSGIGQMNNPCSLAIDKNGFTLVADYNNNRIIQLNASLEFLREIIPGSFGLKQPGRMHLYEDMKRLYIGERGQLNIAVFELS